MEKEMENCVTHTKDEREGDRKRESVKPQRWWQAKRKKKKMPAKTDKRQWPDGLDLCVRAGIPIEDFPFFTRRTARTRH